MEELGIDADVDVEPSAQVRAADVTMDVWLVDSWSGEVVNAAPDEHDAIARLTADDLDGPRLATHVREQVEQVESEDVATGRDARVIREALSASGQLTRGNDDDFADFELPAPRGAGEPSVEDFFGADRAER